MPRPLARRVARLERDSPAVCDDCGMGGPGPTTYKVVLPKAVGAITASQESPKPQRCPHCGRQTEFRVVMPAARG